MEPNGVSNQVVPERIHAPVSNDDLWAMERTFGKGMPNDFTWHCLLLCSPEVVTNKGSAVIDELWTSQCYNMDVLCNQTLVTDF